MIFNKQKIRDLFLSVLIPLKMQIVTFIFYINHEATF